MSMFASCDEAKRAESYNPLLETEWDTPFGIAPFEDIRAEHYVAAFDLAIEELNAEVAQIVADSAAAEFGNVVMALDRSGQRLLDLKDLFEMSEAAISSDEYQRVSQEVWPKITRAIDSVYADDALFAKIKELYDNRKNLDLNSVDMRLLEKKYNRFVRGGALLDSELKGQLLDINAEIATLNSQYSANLLRANNDYKLELTVKQIDGLPNDVRSAARLRADKAGLKDKWLFGLDAASYIPFMTHSTHRELRDSLNRTYLSRGAEANDSIVRRVTALRQDRAKMLGYKNHAEYVISQQMAGSAKAAYELLDAVWKPSIKRAEELIPELEDMLKEDHADATFERYDWLYYLDKLSRRKYNISDEAVRPYFGIEGVRQGLFTLANRLYGLTFRPVGVPLYDQTVTTYEVLGRDGHHLGILYFDLYARSNKGQGAWCGNLREQRTEGGDRITPVVAVVCNFPMAIGTNSTTLLTMTQVETLFHEFGHALHFIFQDVDYRGLAAVEGDFVEFPSQLMENWAFEPEFLERYALHYRTGRPMSDMMIGKIRKCRENIELYESLSYMASAYLDLDLQSLTDSEKLAELDIESFERESLRERRGLMDVMEPRYRLINFPHLFTYDYSAGYYFYLWSEVLDKDCFAAFKESGDIFSSSVADKLRREILRRGGEESGAALYRNFRGAAPDREHLIKAKGL